MVIQYGDVIGVHCLEQEGRTDIMGKFVSERTCMKERLPCRMICCRMIAISLEWAVISLVIATLSSFSVVERSRRSSSFEIFSFNEQISVVSSSAMFTSARHNVCGREPVVANVGNRFEVYEI